VPFADAVSGQRTATGPMPVTISRSPLAHAVEAEVAGFLGDHADKLTADGRQRVVNEQYQRVVRESQLRATP
jgi:hypothetical protein